jgi:hypothetical protein
MSKVFPHGDNVSYHPMGIAKELGGIDQNRVSFTVYKGRIAVKAQVTMEKDLKL